METTAEQHTTVTMARVIIRCGCANPLSHALAQMPCPTPRAFEERPLTPAERVRK